MHTIAYDLAVIVCNYELRSIFKIKINIIRSIKFNMQYTEYIHNIQLSLKIVVIFTVEPRLFMKEILD